MQILVAVKTSTHKKVAWRQCINTVRLLVLLLYRISVYKLTYVPVRSSYMSTPSDQKSTDLSCPLLRMISGATYSGVPQNVHVFRPESMCLEKPKSTILMYPSLSAIKQIGSNCQKKVWQLTFKLCKKFYWNWVNWTKNSLLIYLFELGCRYFNGKTLFMTYLEGGSLAWDLCRWFRGCGDTQKHWRRRRCRTWSSRHQTSLKQEFQNALTGPGQRCRVGWLCHLLFWLRETDLCPWEWSTTPRPARPPSACR